ncbi:MAG: valine--tRNA ligase [Bacteroidota bacterium]
MELLKIYDAKTIEPHWYQYWKDKGFFKSTPDEREPFTIVIPPPNVTGVLHLGHMLNNTIQDILIRKARMEGKNACWVPGTDHASIATEAKVVAMLRERGIKKSDITRDEFLKYAFEWKDKYGGIILSQLEKLGASCDWDRTRFTMEDDLSEAVIDSFIHLFEKGYIYRDLKMINWDPAAKTTLSNEEVIYKEERSKLYYIKYLFENSSEYMLVATTRPETLLGDTAVCVNPNDERYKHLIGKQVRVPLINRLVPIISDEYIDIEFGTGALKVTPAHDTNDYEIGKKYQLETIDVFNEDGTISAAGQFYVGQDRFTVRKQIAKDLEQAGLLEKVEDITNKVGYSERTNVVVEPRLSLQWFVDMKEMVKPALENVMNDEIQFHPERFKNTYKHWLDNIRDWPISRQLWWGQRIPAWYDAQGNFVVAKTVESAIEKFKAKGIEITATDIRQDEDVLDTWFSSWLWPISVFNGFKDPNNADINYYYPTNVLVTGWDIIFFWVARMIFAGYEFKQEKPFQHVYFTGMVRDLQRRKMSKSLGNSPDLLELIDTYGADGVRFGIMACSPAGGDLIFDSPIDPKTKMVINESPLCEQGRNFCNKMWNALRLLKGWEIYEGKNEDNQIAIDWMNHKLNQFTEQYHSSFEQFRFSELLIDLYKFIWDDFCSWYLEMIKPEYQKPIDSYTYQATSEIFEKLITLLHPFMPFITEEIWHHLGERSEKDCMIIKPMIHAATYDAVLIEQAEEVKELITAIREVRAKANMKAKDMIQTYSETKGAAQYSVWKSKIMKLTNSDVFEACDTEIANSSTFVCKGFKYFVVTGKVVDAAEEKIKLTKELDYINGFIRSIEAKLSNEKFANNAPANVLEAERKKLNDGLAKQKMLEEALSQLA